MKKLLLLVSVIVLGVVAMYAQYEEGFNTSRKFKVGEPVTDLTGKSPEGKEFSLSAILQGRYVIVDFWASWCKPCRVSNPYLVKGYNELKDAKFKDASSGMTILSVSLDMDTRNWKNAIERDKLSWEYHISDLKGWESQLARDWEVEVIPQVFLIGPDGKLIGVYFSAEQALEELKQYKKK